MNNLLFIKITILSQVTSLQPIATLDFVLLLNISGDSYSFNANNSSIAFINDIISISATLFHWMYTNETTFRIAVTNECGLSQSIKHNLNSMLS